MGTVVISAFPGCGKTTTYEALKRDPHIEVWDSDSSRFPKDNFPANYIEHIKLGIEQGVDVIFVSSHEIVREALREADIKFALVYPNIGLKTEYIKRYTERGNNEAFILLLDKFWDEWIIAMDKSPSNLKLVLGNDEYIDRTNLKWLIENGFHNQSMER